MKYICEEGKKNDLNVTRRLTGLLMSGSGGQKGSRRRHTQIT